MSLDNGTESEVRNDLQSELTERLNCTYVQFGVHPEPYFHFLEFNV